MAVTISNIIQTIFKTTGARETIKSTNDLGLAAEEATKKQTRLANQSTNNARAFAAQSAGLGGLVAAYAGAAATTFALQQGFSALSAAARSEQIVSGVQQLSASVGESGPVILKALQDITKGQLTLVSAAEKANLALSSGFDTRQISELASVATKASRVLGRDLEDSFTRLIRGSAKLEPELLDELGIFTRLDPAVEAYAIRLGKTTSSLSNFERRQAFVNAVIEEGNRKFGSINLSIPTAAESLAKFSADLQNIGTQLGLFLATIAAPLAEFFSKNAAAGIGLFALILRTVLGKGVEVASNKLRELGDRAEMLGSKVSDSYRKIGSGKEILKDFGLAATNASVNITNLTKAERKRFEGLTELARQSGKEGQVGLSIRQTKEYVGLLNVATRDTKRLIDLEVERGKTARGGVDTQSIFKLEKDLAGIENLRKAAQQTLVLNSPLARVAETISTKVKGGVVGLTNAFGALVTGLSFVGAAVGTATIAFSVLGSVLGVEDKVEAFFNTLYKGIRNLFTGEQQFKDFRTGLTGALNVIFKDLERANRQIKDFEKATFNTKFLGVSIEIIKTKEDLAKDLQKLITEASTEVSTSTALQNNVGTAVGGAIFAGLSAYITSRAFVGLLSRTIVGGLIPGGAIVGAATAVAGAIGAVTSARTEELNQVQQLRQANFDLAASSLGLVTSREQLTASDLRRAESLAVVIGKIEEEEKKLGALTPQQRLYFEIQRQAAVEAFKYADAIEVVGRASRETGISVDKLFEAFKESITKVPGEQFVSELRTQLQLLSEEPVPITLRLVNISDISEAIRNISTQISRTRSVVDEAEAAISGNSVMRQVTVTETDPAAVQAREAALEIVRRQATVQNTLVGLTSLERDFTLELNQGLLNREQISASLANINKLIARSSAEALEVEKQIGKAREALASAEDEQFRDQLGAQIRILEATRTQNIEALALLTTQRDRLSVEARIQDLTLRTAELIRTTFSQQIAAAAKLNFFLNENLELASDKEQIDANAIKFLTDQVRESQSAVDLQRELLSTKIQINGVEKSLVELTIEEARASADLTESQIRSREAFQGNVVQLANAGRESRRALVGLFAEAIFEIEKLSKDIERRLKELDNQLKELKISNRLSDLNRQLDLSRQSTELTRRSIELEKQRIDIRLESTRLLEEENKRLATRSLLLARDISANPVLGAFFTEEQKQQLEIKIAEADLLELERITQAQVQAMTERQTQESRLTQLNIQALENERDFRLRILGAEKELQIARATNQRDLALLDVQNTEARFTALREQVKIFQEFVTELARALAEDRIQRQIQAAGSLEAFKRQEEERINRANANLGPGESAARNLVAGARNEAEAITALLNPVIDGLRTRFSELADSIRPERLEQLRSYIGTIFRETSGAAEKAFSAQINAQRDYTQTSIRLLNEESAIRIGINKNEVQSLNNRLQLARDNLARLRIIAEASNSLSIKLASDLVKNIRDGFGEGIKGIFDEILKGQEEGAEKLSKRIRAKANEGLVNLLRSIGSSVSQRLVIEPIQKLITENLTGPILSFFGIKENDPLRQAIEGNTQAVRDLTITMQGGSVANRYTGEGTGSATAGAFKETTKQSEGFTDRLKDLGVNFQTVGTVAATTFTAVLASTRDWKKAFIYTVVSAFATALSQIAAKQLFSSATNTIGTNIFSGIGNWFSGIFRSPGPTPNTITPTISGAEPLFNLSSIGGSIRQLAVGGMLSGRDRVPALLEPGEFVIRRPSAMAIGGDALNQMNATGQVPAGNVTVNVTNQGTPQEPAARPVVSRQGENFVVDIVLKDIQNNGPIRRTLRGMR